MASELVMVNGLPGSGKTTLAVALAASMNAQRNEAINSRSEIVDHARSLAASPHWYKQAH